MRLDREYRVEAAVSRDVTRPRIASAWLDVESKRLVATTGYALAVVPVDLDKRDVSGPVSAAAVKAARLSNMGAVCRRGFVVLGDMLFRRARDVKHPAGSAADRAAVWPTFKPSDKGTVTFGIAPARLMGLAQAIGAGGPHALVGITVKLPSDGKPMLDGILVTRDDLSVDGPVGVLMPARVGK